jgi:hypothetical protein
MFGPDAALKYYVMQERFRDLVTESERQHQIGLARAAVPHPRRNRLFAARTIIATVLHRAGDWLMPEDVHVGSGQPAATLGLRPGR